jgi:hypothetical protein
MFLLCANFFFLNLISDPKTDQLKGFNPTVYTYKMLCYNLMQILEDPLVYELLIFHQFNL